MKRILNADADLTWSWRTPQCRVRCSRCTSSCPGSGTDRPTRCQILPSAVVQLNLNIILEYYLKRSWPFLDSGFMFELLRTCWFNNCMLIYDLVTDMTVAQVLRYLDISVFTNSCWIEGRFFRSYQSSHIMFWISSRQLLTVWQVMIWTHHWTLRSRTLPRALH